MAGSTLANCMTQIGMDENVRVAAGQYREIKKSPVKYKRCVKKCSLKEKRNIDTVLSYLKLAPEEFDVKDEKEQEEAQTVNVLRKSLGKDIFSRVLKKATSDPSSPSFLGKKAKTLVGEEGLAMVPCKGSSSSSWEKAPKQSPLASLDLDENEAQELHQWMMQSCVLEKKSEKEREGHQRLEETCCFCELKGKSFKTCSQSHQQKAFGGQKEKPSLPQKQFLA